MTSVLIDIPSDLLREIITHVPLSDLMSLCSTDTTIQKICNNDRLLAQVIAEQTGYTSKPEQFTWKQFASLLARDEIRQVNMIYKNNIIGTIWLWPTKKLRQVEEEIFYPNKAELAVKFSPQIYLLVNETFYKTSTTISEYINSTNSIWLNSQEIEIIDDIREIKRIKGACHRCFSLNTQTSAVQTRSADEPMSTYQQCLDCGYQRKY